MALPEEARASEITFLPVDYEPTLSLEKSLGGRARRLWEERFAECAEYASDAAYIPTGIGDAPEDNTGVKIWKYGDGAQVPSYIDLDQQFGRVPKLLFLPASTFATDHVAGLCAVAEKYKSMGVKKIIVLLTALAHERQDHQFPDEHGNPILQVTMLKQMVNNFADSVIDG
ncbi:MAG: hypothetical protein AAB803_00600, partial [Patescibacteria group bacterium]